MSSASRMSAPLGPPPSSGACGHPRPPRAAAAPVCASSRSRGSSVSKNVELDVGLGLGALALEHRPLGGRKPAESTMPGGGEDSAPRPPRAEAPCEHAVALEESPPRLTSSSAATGPCEPLGSGGSGSVWLARDERSARDVALKVVPREGKAGSRAEREVEAATRLRHPRCLRALALDRDDDHVYVAYEYVRGRRCARRCATAELDDAAAVEAAAQILEALAHAHGSEVVHRDVKPANVMLEDGEGVSIRAARLRARAARGGGDAHRGRRRARHARLHRPGAPRRARRRPARPTSGRSASSSGSRSSAGTPSCGHAVARRDGEADRAGARRRSPRSAPTSRARLCATVDRMLELDPARRPPAKRLAGALRRLGRVARPAAARRPARSRRSARTRLPAVLAATLAGGATTAPAVLPARLAVPVRRPGGARLAPQPARRPRARAGRARPPARQPLARSRARCTSRSRAGWFAALPRRSPPGLLWCLGPAAGPARRPARWRP